MPEPPNEANYQARLYSAHFREESWQQEATPSNLFSQGAIDHTDVRKEQEKMKGACPAHGDRGRAKNSSVICNSQHCYRETEQGEGIEPPRNFPSCHPHPQTLKTREASNV